MGGLQDCGVENRVAKKFYLSPLLREGVLSMYDRVLFEREGGRELSREDTREGKRGE